MSSGLGRIANLILVRLPSAPAQFGVGNLTSRVRAFVLGLVAIFASGCANEEAEHAHSHIVYHHRPADFKAAVLRLDEMHRILTGPAALPPAKSFADLSNSHDDDQNDDGDSHLDEVISVGIFQEYFDIVRWLPTIAADNDLPKSEWDPINESSQTLSQLVKEIERDLNLPDLDGQSVDDRRRALYLDRSTRFEAAISELKAKLSAYDAWLNKVVN